MKQHTFLWLIMACFGLVSCITTKDVRYAQPSESLVINEEGLVPYNFTEYRITRNDMLNLNIVTTPKGDAAQFYSSLNTSSNGQSNTGSGGSAATTGSGGGEGGNAAFYFNGLKVDMNGDIYVFGIGNVKAEGRTLADVSAEIQSRVNQNFLRGKSEVRLNTDGITYYILGDIETTGVTGEKKTYKNTMNLFEMFAINGGLNRTIDRKNIEIHRKYPEGIKIVKLDLTREDVMNSPYFWVQNGDEIYLKTRSKSLNGFGKDPIQTLTTGVSLLTTVMSVYLILTRL